MSSSSHRRLDSFSFEPPLQSPSTLTPTSSRQQYPFPQYDSYRGHARRGSTASIASIASIATSIGGPLDTATQVTLGPSEELAQNAISSLLSSPIVRTGLIPQSALATSATHRAPTSRDIPPVTLTQVPHVDNAAFASYLSRIGPLFERYQSTRGAVPEPISPTKERPPPRFDNRPDFDRRSSYLSSPPATPLTPSTPSSARHGSYFWAPPSPERRRSSARPKRDPYAATPLSTIPSVYFEESFHLENPRTFDVVSERSDIIPPPPPSANSSNTSGAPVAPTRKALHTNAILQEKLSWYMDTVEVHLITSIASASQSFFEALGSLKQLQSEAEESIAKIKSLRSALQHLDSGMAVGGLEIVNMKRRRENVHKLSGAVNQLCDVVESARKCDDMVEAGDLEGANTELEDLEALIGGVPSPAGSVDRGYQPIDLRRLKALNMITDGLSQLRIRIGRGFEARFLDALLTDLRQHVESVPPRETLQRWASSTYRVRGDAGRGKISNPEYLKTNDTLRPALLGALAGLSASGQASRAATAYREAVMREIKSMIRKNLPSSSDDDADSTISASTRGGRQLTQQDKSAILARNLRALDPEAAEDLLVKVYTTVGEALRRLGVQVKVLLDVTLSIETPKTPGIQNHVTDPIGQSTQIRDEVTQALDLSSLLGQAVDVVQTQITKVLKVRSEQNSHLPLQDFLRYFALNRLFADECEAVSSRGGEALKDVVNAHVKDFVQFFADTEKQRIQQLLEADKWDAKDFSPADEVVLQRVLEGMNRTPKAWTSYTQLWEDALSKDTSNGTTTSNGDGATADKARSATIDEQRYVLVSSSIAALEGIDHFSTVIASIPGLTAEASLKFLEYLKLFNSRCTQLILGAGATRSAGLKNITSKHLALASQACSFIITLIPYIREYVRRQSPSSVTSILPEFDKVKRSFQEHQNSIHEKLVEIMSSRSHAHINAVNKIQWDNLPKDAPISVPIEALAKETGTLRRVLMRYVAEMDVKMIMIPIFNQYSQDWQRAFREVPVTTDRGKANLLQAAEYLSLRFSKIEESGDLSEKLVSIVKERQIQAPAPPPPPPSQTPKTTAPTLAKAQAPPSSSPRNSSDARNSTSSRDKLSTHASDAAPAPVPVPALPSRPSIEKKPESKPVPPEPQKAETESTPSTIAPVVEPHVNGTKEKSTEDGDVRSNDGNGAEASSVENGISQSASPSASGDAGESESTVVEPAIPVEEVVAEEHAHAAPVEDADGG